MKALFRVNRSSLSGYKSYFRQHEFWISPKVSSEIKEAPGVTGFPAAHPNTEGSSGLQLSVITHTVPSPAPRSLFLMSSPSWGLCLRSEAGKACCKQPHIIYTQTLEVYSRGKFMEPLGHLMVISVPRDPGTNLPISPEALLSDRIGLTRWF